jgi:hypothetical protein
MVASVTNAVIVRETLQIKKDLKCVVVHCPTSVAHRCLSLLSSHVRYIGVGAALENFPARKRKKVLVPRMQEK